MMQIIANDMCNKSSLIIRTEQYKPREYPILQPAKYEKVGIKGADK